MGYSTLIVTDEGTRPALPEPIPDPELEYSKQSETLMVIFKCY